MSAITRRSLLASSALAAASLPAIARHASQAAAKSASGREKLLMDLGWRFHLGHAADPTKDFGFGKDQSTYAKSGSVADAAMPDFDDGAWRAVDLPHDWAVELAPVATPNPPADDPRASHGFRPLGRDWPETSIGWYRLSFDLPASDLGRRLALEFDGAFRDCIVMLNGYAVGRNESGYAPFRIDITDYVNCGGRNVLALRVDATLGEGWFYEGAGIYRHVWLTKTDPLHVRQWGTWVRTSLSGSAAAATIGTEIANERSTPCELRIASTVLGADGRIVAKSLSPPHILGADESKTIAQNTTIANPMLWSVDAPNLYQLRTQILCNGAAVDDMVTTFGVRTVRFDAEHGFFLNGERLKLKGACIHQDFAGVGSALPDALHEFRIRRLKEMGANAIRCAHNPPAPGLLDACDRLGMLVIDETRRMSSDEEGLSELSRMVRRDRNHPSVILWSIGNEEHGEQATSLGAHVAATMRREILALDPTRPITAAIDDPKAWGTGITPALDVMGSNYRLPEIVDFHRARPDIPLVATEISSSVDTRGIYVRDPASGYVVAYDTEFPWWGSTQEAAWDIVAHHDFIAGGFVWAGFDYRGEPLPQTAYPNNSSQCGLMDLCGFAKDSYFYYRAWWRDEPSLHLFPHWNWPGREGQPVDVWCHGNFERIELFLNGVSQGSRAVTPYKHVQWQIPYAPGVIEARGWRQEGIVATAQRETANAPARISLTSNRDAMDANGEDVVLVTARIVDDQGRDAPAANNRITFDVTGTGRVIGVGNGDPRCVEPDKAASRSAFNGLCLAIVQAERTPGPIIVRATSPGLVAATLSLTARSAQARPAVRSR
jgi:beta-galactosidase